MLLLIRNDRVVSPLELSVYKSLRRRAVGMCEITALGDFQGLWERVGDRTGSSSVSHPFPSVRHFHRGGGRHDFCFVIGPVKLSASLLISKLLAVGPYLRLMLHILLRLDHSEGMAEAFVLDDGLYGFTRWSLLKTR